MDSVSVRSTRSTIKEKDHSLTIPQGKWKCISFRAYTFHVSEDTYLNNFMIAAGFLEVAQDIIVLFAVSLQWTNFVQLIRCHDDPFLWEVLSGCN